MYTEVAGVTENNVIRVFCILLERNKVRYTHIHQATLNRQHYQLECSKEPYTCISRGASVGRYTSTSQVHMHKLVARVATPVHVDIHVHDDMVKRSSGC